METERYQKYEQAVKHARGLKEFYQHLVVYVVFVMVLLFFKPRIIAFIQANTENIDPQFLDWLHININLTPLIWATGVAIHAIYTYRLKFLFFKDWEDRKIQELIEEEHKNKNMNWE